MENHQQLVPVREMKDSVITVVKESSRNVVNEDKQRNMDLMNVIKSELEEENLMNVIKSELEEENLKMLDYAEMGSIEQVEMEVIEQKHEAVVGKRD
ncbi:hypothetical protein SUGI_0152740 [Cryptomeria japonica]|nr:hypothetical protein SUGI_0152740 [Cryptomeria japonica]